MSGFYGITLDKLSQPATWLEAPMVVLYFAVLLVLVLLVLFHLSVISKPLRQAPASSEHLDNYGYMGYGMVSQNGNSNGQVSAAGPTLRSASSFSSSNQGEPNTQSLASYAWMNPSSPAPGYQNGQIGAGSSERLTAMRQDPAFFTVDPLLEAYQLSTMDDGSDLISNISAQDTQNAAQVASMAQAAPPLAPTSTAERLRNKARVNMKGRFGNQERLTNTDYVIGAVQNAKLY